MPQFSLFQYAFDITNFEDAIMVSLEQEDTSLARKSGGDLLNIGFHIMKVCNTFISCDHCSFDT